MSTSLPASVLSIVLVLTPSLPSAHFIADSGTTVLANTLSGLGVDEYFIRTDSAGTRSLLTDALGSTVALMNSGGVQAQYTYEPFGKSTAGAGTNPFQYTLEFCPQKSQSDFGDLSPGNVSHFTGQNGATSPRLRREASDKFLLVTCHCVCYGHGFVNCYLHRMRE